jgi:hypothetical protein
MSNFHPTSHPFATFNEVVEVEGKEVEVVNCYGFAAMIIQTIQDPLAPIERPDGLKTAIEMAKEAIKISNPNINSDKLIERCKDNNEGAVRQAMSLIADALQSKATEAFEAKGKANE